MSQKSSTNEIFNNTKRDYKDALQTKCGYKSTLSYIRTEEIISEEKEVAEELNTCFHNAVASLGISENDFILNSCYSDNPH